MTFGLRVTLTARDTATLSTLASRAPHLVDSPWEEHSARDEVVLTSSALDEDLAIDLKKRGLDVVRFADPAARVPHGTVPLVEPFHPSLLKIRRARGLLEAVRPMRVADAVPAEAVFFARVDDVTGTGGAHHLLERLLLLGRDDVVVGEIDMPEGRVLLARIPTPPLYLLLRAREEPLEGVRVFARAADTARVFTEWGTAHPLQTLLDERLAQADRIAFVSADGSMRLAGTKWPLKSILAAVRPDLQARHDLLEPIEGSLSFPVRLRFGPADPVDPELWVLDPEQLARLESFVDTAPADEIGRLLVSRVAAVDGRPRYVVREAVRPQVPRLGARVSSLVDVAGFARAPAYDNLYLPPARRIVPQLARDQMKALLGLDSAAAVVVDEDTDGLRVIHVKTLEDAPLTRFTTWIATDRRLELDRLVEDAVASFPGVSIERPTRKAPEEVATEAREKQAPRAPREKPKPGVGTPRPISLDEQPVANDVAALREEARVLEEAVLGPAAVDAGSWRSLGVVKSSLDEHDDAGACLEVALFLGAPPDITAGELAGERVASLPRNRAEPSVVDLAVRERLTREEASLLGARVVQALAKGEPLLEDVLQHTTQLFLRDDVLVSRRLQWAVLHAISARARDALGATRAKEAVLGALNARGLSETIDVPRFVRTQLALSGGDPAAPIDRSRGEQLVHLEKLLSRAVPNPTRLTDARDAFLRAIFAVGLGRLGGGAADIVRSLQSEIDAHDPPNRALLQLYIARLSHFLTHGSREVWKSEVDGVLQSLARPEERRVVEWLTKRSLWLRPTPPEEAPQGLRPALERHLVAAEQRVDELAVATGKVHEMPGLYDYEVATATERVLRAALASGRDEVIRATLLAALKGLPRIRILAHRVRALGACVRAAATLEDEPLVDECLEGIASATRSQNVPSVRDLLVAVKPALAALRRLGAADAAQRFLSSLEPVAAARDRETGPLLAALSDGFLQLGETDRAKELLAQALGRAMLVDTQHVDRYETGVAILEALTHWDVEARASQCQSIIDQLPRFIDTFTTSRYFATHQILIAERLVETLVDDVTLRSDRLQAYLDGEEQQIRRRVISQWSALCGR